MFIPDREKTNRGAITWVAPRLADAVNPGTCKRLIQGYGPELVYFLAEWESRFEITVALISPAFSAVPLQIT